MVSSKRSARALDVLAQPLIAQGPNLFVEGIWQCLMQSNSETAVVKQLLGSGYHTCSGFFFLKALLIPYLEICFGAGRRPSFTG